MRKTTVMRIAAILTLVGSTAVAGNINFDMRADLVNKKYNQEQSKPDSTAFTFNRFRMGYIGKLNETTTFNATFNIPGANGTTTTRDGLSGYVDMAFVSKTIADGLKLDTGKLYLQANGVEGMNSNADLYQYTKPTLVHLATMGFYQTGARFDYTMGDHNLKLLATNVGQDFGSSNQDMMAMGVRYQGKFGGGGIVPVISYFTEPRTTTLNALNTYMNVGARITSISNMDIDVDYASHTLKGATTVDVNDTAGGFYVLARYKMDNGFRPHVKFENSTYQKYTSTVNNTKTAYTVITAALEYYPVNNENFRYHIAYVQNGWKTTTTTAAGSTDGTDNKDTTMYTGVRILADFLK